MKATETITNLNGLISASLNSGAKKSAINLWKEIRAQGYKISSSDDETSRPFFVGLQALIIKIAQDQYIYKELVKRSKRVII